MSRNKASSSSGLHRRAVFFLSFAFFLTNLPYRQVPTIDGAVRATLARNIVTSGQWFPLTLHGETFIDHPPLFVWATALSFKAFGITDFAALLPMHLCAFFLLLVLYLIAREMGASRGLGLLALIILVTTRDFILSSVRGYIEPMLELWIYLGLYFALRVFNTSVKIGRIDSFQTNRHCSILPAVFALLCSSCVALAWFSKGPPALWPTVFFPLVMFQGNKMNWRRLNALLVYFLGLVGFAFAFWFVLQKNVEVNSAFQVYWNKQILGSALEGRGHAQSQDLGYFFRILRTSYWPWLAFLIIGFLLELKPAKKGEEALPLRLNIPPLYLFLFGCGFLGGFSLLHWKFWYYISPAYPAFALFIAVSIFRKIASVFDWRWFPRGVITASVIFVLANSVWPLRLFRDRVPEVTAFAPTVRMSETKQPVWFLHDTLDHNLISTSGEWSFWREGFPSREVRKIPTSQLSLWAGPHDHGSTGFAWLITDEPHWRELQENCKLKWCSDARIIQTHPNSKTLLIHI